MIVYGMLRLEAGLDGEQLIIVRVDYAYPYLESMIEVLIPLYLIVSGNWWLSQSMRLHLVAGGGG